MTRWRSGRGVGGRWVGGGVGDSDGGSALVEFCVLATLMLVPVVYLTLALGRLQAGAYAAQGAAREAGRAFVTAADPGGGQQRAVAAGAIAVQDQGFHAPNDAAVRVECEPVDCLTPDARVVVRATVQVRLPGVPQFVNRFVPLQVQLTATHVATVDRFRDRRAGG